MTSEKTSAPLEIERKFLVKSDAWKKLGKPVLYRQGYLTQDNSRTVRVRLAGDKGYLTIKGKTTGFSRVEFEYEIPASDAQNMLDTLAFHPLIEKTRTCVTYAGHVWEVDEFFGENAGLVMAEIELTSETELFEKPDWIGEEVTGDPRYYNSALAKCPYSSWK